MPGELTRFAAFSRHSENIPVAVPFAGEGEPAPVWRKERIRIRLDMLRQRGCAAPFVGGNPNVAPIDKSQLFSIRAERRHTRADDRLLRRQTELSESRLRAAEPCREQPNNCNDVPFHELSELSPLCSPRPKEMEGFSTLAKRPLRCWVLAAGQETVCLTWICPWRPGRIRERV